MKRQKKEREKERSKGGSAADEEEEEEGLLTDFLDWNIEKEERRIRNGERRKTQNPKTPTAEKMEERQACNRQRREDKINERRQSIHQSKARAKRRKVGLFCLQVWMFSSEGRVVRQHLIQLPSIADKTNKEQQEGNTVLCVAIKRAFQSNRQREVRAADHYHHDRHLPSLIASSFPLVS